MIWVKECLSKKNFANFSKMNLSNISVCSEKNLKTNKTIQTVLRTSSENQWEHEKNINNRFQ